MQIEAIDVDVDIDEIDVAEPPPQALTTTSGVIVGVAMMDASEARQVVETIKGHLDHARRLLLDLEEREGWRALGYKSWRECAAAEFGQSQAYLYRQLAAAKIEQAIDSPIGEIPESHLRPLAALDSPAEQKQALDQAYAKTNGQPTAKDVRAEADAISGQTPADLTRAGVQLTKHGAWFQATGFSGEMNGWTTGRAMPYQSAVNEARQEIQRRAKAAQMTSAINRPDGSPAGTLPIPPDLMGWRWEASPPNTYQLTNGTHTTNREEHPHHAIVAARNLRDDARLDETIAAYDSALAAASGVVETNDDAVIADIRAKAEALDLKLIWEDDRVTLYWPEEEDQLDQLDLLSYGAALEWLETQAPSAAERRQAFLGAQARQPGNAPPPADDAASDRAAHLTKEARDEERLMQARILIERKDYADARALLDQIEVSTWKAAPLQARLARCAALDFHNQQRARLLNFSQSAMISQTTYTQALDHIKALLMLIPE